MPRRHTLVVPHGVKLHATAESSNGWYKVTYKGQTGWIGGEPYSKFVPTPVKPKITYTKINDVVEVVAGGLCLNSKPEPNVGTMNVLPQGAKVVATEKSSNGWYKVTYQGQTGWIGGEPYSKVIGQVKPQQPNTPSSIQQKPLGKVEVTADGLYMNANPEPNDGIITALKQGTVVPYYKVSNNGWYEVYYNGKMGWIGGAPYSKIVGSSIQQQAPKKQEIATVQSPVGLWLNGSPNTSNPIEVMPYNATMKVLGQQGNWTKVDYNGQIGWAYTQYLNISGSSSSNNSSSNSSSSDKLSQIGTGTISANGGLWLNENPNLSNPNGIEVIPNGSKVSIYKVDGNWDYIEYNGQFGWSYNQYINTNTTNNQRTATVNSRVGLWLNGNPDLNNPDGIEVMPYKATMKVLGQQGNWTKVDYNGQIGWAYTQYLNLN